MPHDPTHTEPTMTQIMFSRRTFAAVTVLAGASVTVSRLWAQPRLEKVKVTIAAAGKGSFYHLPLIIADQLGYFSAEGLDVDLVDFESGSAALQTAPLDSTDIISGAYENTLKLQVTGQSYQSFILQGRAPAISMGLSLRVLPHYRTPADLKGMKIGVSTPGSPTHMVANLMLSRGGLSPSDVTFLEVGTGHGALSALRNGQIDVLSNVDPVMTILEQKGEIRLIADTRTLKDTINVFGGPMPSGCLYAPSGFIQKNPNTVQAVAYAIAHALKWLQTAGPLDILRAVPQSFLLGDRALYLAAFHKVREAISPDGMMSDYAPRHVARVLAGFDPSIRLEKIELSKTFTNEFAKKAKDRFKA